MTITNTNRDNSLDILRIVACMMVIMMHSPVPLAEGKSPLLGAISYLMAPCNGLFFMASGALLFGRGLPLWPVSKETTRTNRVAGVCVECGLYID